MVSSNIASNTEMCFGLRGESAIIEKKIAIMTVTATLILTGMFLQPKTGSTKKKAEILVNTIAKPSSLSIIYAWSILQTVAEVRPLHKSVSNILDMAKNFVGKLENHLQHPAAKEQHDRTDRHELGHYR